MGQFGAITRRESPQGRRTTSDSRTLQKNSNLEIVEVNLDRICGGVTAENDLSNGLDLDL